MVLLLWYLQAVPVVAAQLQQTLSGCSSGRGQRKGSLHVDGPLTQPPLNTVRLVELVHLDQRTISSESEAPKPFHPGKLTLLI